MWWEKTKCSCAVSCSAVVQSEIMFKLILVEWIDGEIYRLKMFNNLVNEPFWKVSFLKNYPLAVKQWWQFIQNGWCDAKKDSPTRVCHRAPESSHMLVVYEPLVSKVGRDTECCSCVVLSKQNNDFNKHERNWNTRTGMDLKVQSFSILTLYFIREKGRRGPSCQEVCSTLWHSCLY